MELIEAARRLAEDEPTFHYTYYESDVHECLHCKGDDERIKDDGPFGYHYAFKHESDCPWLSGPRILDVINVAHDVVDGFDRGLSKHYMNALLTRLAAALGSTGE